MSASDDLRRTADRVTELERALDAAEREANRLAKENDGQLDDIHELRSAARVAGLGEQARQALLMADQYMREGDTYESPRVRDCLLQALACVVEAAKEAA